MFRGVLATTVAAGLAAGVFATVASAGPRTIVSVSCMNGGQTSITVKGNPLSVDFTWYSYQDGTSATTTAGPIGGMAGRTLSRTTPSPSNGNPSYQFVPYTFKYIVRYSHSSISSSTPLTCIAAQSETNCLYTSSDTSTGDTFSTDPATNTFTLQSGDTFLWSCNGPTFGVTGKDTLSTDCLTDTVNLGFADDEFYNGADTLFTCATRT